MTKKFLLLPILSTFFIGSVALGQSAEDNWNSVPKEMKTQMMKRADTDGDGVVSDAEKDAFKEARKEMRTQKRERKREHRNEFSQMSDAEKEAFKAEHADQISARQERRETRRQRRQGGN